MNNFTAPIESIGTINGQTAASLIGASADIALVIDSGGVIRDLSVNVEEFQSRDAEQWLGKRWLDTVSRESREKVTQLLSDKPLALQRQRQINHLIDGGDDLLMLYRVVSLNDSGYRIAVGKDMSSLTRLQQRLVNAQQSLERDYFQLRQFETQYKLLFKAVGEAVIIANAVDFSVLEANPAACLLFGIPERKMIGSSVLHCFDGNSSQPFEDAFSSLRINGRNLTKSLEIVVSDTLLSVQLALFRTDNQPRVLVRLEKKIDVVGKLMQPENYGRLLSLVENAPDALVVTDMRGNILTVNSEFLDLTQLASAEHALGQRLSNWLGQSGIDFQIIMSGLREHGSVRLYTTQVCGEFGSYCEVEVSAVKASDAELDYMLFSIRNTSRRLVEKDENSSSHLKSIEQLTQLVGRVPLKELVRESTEIIELQCIQSALKLTNNNRASAAELLGLSRQSLYVKLRRYAIDEESS